MAESKNKLSILSFGSVESTDLATAITNATTSFTCLITNVTSPIETRGETTEDARFCPDGDSIVEKDTTDIEISELSITGVADTGDTDYDAGVTLLQTMFTNDTMGTYLFTHPNGATQKWANIKLLQAPEDVPQGGANDKIPFTIRAQLKTRLSTT